jgi:UDP-N-acetylmuramoylalanine--D-glutamate ligase
MSTSHVIGGYDFGDATVLVAGLGISGESVTHILAVHGVPYVSVDQKKSDATYHSFDQVDWANISLVVTSPVFKPTSPFLLEAARRHIPVWSEVEFAWRTRVSRPQTGKPAGWIGITGTDGKTTTTEMIAAMLKAQGRVCPAVGNIGSPVSTAVQDPRNDGFVVELSSFAMHFTNSLHLDVAVWTNISADHLDWHGGFANYSHDKSKVFTNAQKAIVYNADDPVVSKYARAVQLPSTCHKVGFTLHEPSDGQIGVTDGWIVDRSALSTDSHAERVVALSDFSQQMCDADGTVYPHLIADALAAIGAARAVHVPVSAIRSALTSFTPDPHRIQLVAQYRHPHASTQSAQASDAQTVRFIDDSKATDVLAAQASLSSFPDHRVIWICGGLAKGATFTDLIRHNKAKMKAAIVIGVDQTPFTTALAAGGDVPYTCITPGDSGQHVMDQAIAAAMRYAQPGDIVLLAPAAASMDQFRNYPDRGDKFAAAARAWIAAQKD